MTGTAFGDDVEAGAGRDIVHTDRGNGDVCDGAGWDRLFGGAGANDLYGASGGDYLDGGTGSAQLNASIDCDVTGAFSDDTGNDLLGRIGR